MCRREITSVLDKGFQEGKKKGSGLHSFPFFVVPDLRTTAEYFPGEYGRVLLRDALATGIDDILLCAF